MNTILKYTKLALLGTLTVTLTLVLWPIGYVLSKLMPTKVRVTGLRSKTLTIMIGRQGKEVMGIGFGW